MIITKTIASAALSLVINNVAVQANLLLGNANGCEMAAATAAQWRRSGAIVAEQRVGNWCVTGRVLNGHWLSEQWEAGPRKGEKSRGWLVQIPLRPQHVESRHRGAALDSPWALDVLDPEIATRIRYRQSLSSPDAHHRKSLSLALKGALVLTHPHPDGGSYSVVIERGAIR
jgi:hypothetical protein